MFTGIIERQSQIEAISRQGLKTFVRLGRPDSFTKLYEGASIACNGICLTVVRFVNTSFEVELMNETLHKSNASKWKRGDTINLERALEIGARLDGHWVQGHVDTVLTLANVRDRQGTVYLEFSYPAQDRALLVPQGSIAVNGVSLTIAELTVERFAVALIGHTLENTNLSRLQIGQHVNIEYDVLGKYLARQMQSGTPKITESWLHEQGF